MSSFVAPPLSSKHMHTGAEVAGSVLMDSSGLQVRSSPDILDEVQKIVGYPQSEKKRELPSSQASLPLSEELEDIESSNRRQNAYREFGRSEAIPVDDKNDDM